MYDRLRNQKKLGDNWSDSRYPKTVHCLLEVISKEKKELSIYISTLEQWTGLQIQKKSGWQSRRLGQQINQKMPYFKFTTKVQKVK